MSYVLIPVLVVLMALVAWLSSPAVLALAIMSSAMVKNRSISAFWRRSSSAVGGAALATLDVLRRQPGSQP